MIDTTKYPRLVAKWLMVALGSFPGLVSLVSNLNAQTTPRITSVIPVEDDLEISWVGNAKAYQVETAFTPPKWAAEFITTETTARIPRVDATRYARIRALDDDIELYFEPEDRIALLNEILETVNSLIVEDSPAETNSKVAQYLITEVPEVSNVTISDSSVWGELPDGKTITIVNNRHDSPEVAVNAGPPEIANDGTREARADPATPTGIPVSDKVYLLSSRLIKQPLVGDLATMFSRNNYDVERHTATLAALQHVNNAGVFYYEGHTAVRDDINRFIIVTDDTIDHPIAREFEKLVGAGYAIIPPRKGKVHYSITGEFVQKFMTFSANSFVFLNSCSSVWSASYFDKSTFAGWDARSEDNGGWRSAYFLFDRLLGANYNSGFVSAWGLGVSPPQRAFNYPAIYDEMKRRSLHISRPFFELEAATLQITESLGFGILAPSIEYMWVDESKGELHINGIFDSAAPTQVSVQGTVIAPSSVSSNVVTCPLPATQQPFAGEVSVFQRGHFSNIVPLTEWWVDATLVRYPYKGIEQPSATSKVKLHFRADIHESRRLPDVKPVFVGAGAKAAADSSGQITNASGVHTQNSNGAVTTLEWKLENPVPIPAVFSFDQPPFGVTGSLFIRESYSAADISATAYSGNVVREIGTRDGEETTNYLRDGGTRAFPGGTAGFDAKSFMVRNGESSTAGDTGKFTWEASSAKYLPNQKHHAR